MEQNNESKITLHYSRPLSRDSKCQSCGMPLTEEGFPWTKAMLSPRVREGIKTFYFTTNTFSLRVAHYKANPKASIYFCDTEGFKGMMLRGTMEVLTDAASKEMIWRDGDEQYYPGGVTDPNYCVLKFTATDGRFYSDFYPRSFVIE